jgi:hypothetical protein
MRKDYSQTTAAFKYKLCGSPRTIAYETSEFIVTTSLAAAKGTDAQGVPQSVVATDGASEEGF